MEVPKDIIKYKFRHSTYYAEISPNKKYLAVVGKKIYIYNYETGKKEKVYQILRYPSKIAFSNDSSLLAIKNTSGHIAVVNILTDEVVCENKMHNVEGCELYFSSDNRYIITGDWDGNIMLLDIIKNDYKDLCVFQKNENNGHLHNIQREGDDKFIFQSSYFGNFTKGEWSYPFSNGMEIKNNKGFEMELYNPKNHLYARLTSAWEGYNIVNEQENTIMTLELLNRIERYHASLDGVAWSVDGEYFATVIKRYDPEENVVNSIRFYETKTWTIVKEYDMKYACFVRFTPDGENIILGSWLAGYCIDIKELER